jgi:hypothetical protein
MDVNNKTKVIKALRNNNEVDFALVSVLPNVRLKVKFY